MLGSQPVTSPVSHSKANPSNVALLSNPTEYRQIVGALQYITITRPDITFAVNHACQHMHQPTTHHMVAVKRILRFLKSTPTHNLFLRPGPLHLVAYCDADWAGDPIDRRSTNGFCVFFGSSPVSWGAKKQPTISRSSTEAEYRCLALTAAELSWLRSLLRDLHIPLCKMPIIWCDNISAISLASNPIYHARTKHLEVDYHYIREKVVNKELAVQYVSTHEQIADIFTKGLSSKKVRDL